MPTGYTPVFQILKGGNDVTNQFNDRATSISVTCIGGGGGGDLLDIEIDDRDWAVAYPAVGDSLEVHLGYKEIGMAYMGTFEIDEVTFKGMPKAIRLHGNSNAMQNAMKSPMTKDYSNKTVGDLVKDIAEKGGLTAKIEGDLANKKVPFKNVITSPYHMLHELERAYNGVAKITDSTISFTPRDTGLAASGGYVPIIMLRPEHFGTWEVKHTSRPDYGKVVASYTDKDDFFSRKFVEQEREGGSDDSKKRQPFPIGKIFNSKEEAEAAAKSQMQALVRSTGYASLTLAKGDPWIKDQQRLLITGMRDGVNGSYVIDVAVHTYVKQSGISTSIQARPPGDGSDFESKFEKGDTSTGSFLQIDPGQIMGEALKMPDAANLLLNLLQ